MTAVPVLEQRRRFFKETNPDLYDYIRRLEWSKAYESAGDLASGALDGHGAANRLWSESGRLAEAAKRITETGD